MRFDYFVTRRDMGSVVPFTLAEDDYRRIAFMRDNLEIASGSPALNRRDSWHAIVRGARFVITIHDESFLVLQREFKRFNKNRRRLEVLAQDDTLRWTVESVGRFAGHVKRVDRSLVGTLTRSGASCIAPTETEQLLVAMLDALQVRLVLSVPWIGLAFRGF